ncbi:MAG: hypothetical protein R2874_10175 [Desulfobacterales bacterium]
MDFKNQKSNVEQCGGKIKKLGEKIKFSPNKPLKKIRVDAVGPRIKLTSQFKMKFFQTTKADAIIKKQISTAKKKAPPIS